MNQIFLETKNRLHSKVTNDGFKLKGQTYYRLMNGYVQGFKIYTNHLSYSIRFFQEALCLGIDKTYEGCDVHKFWSGTGPFSLGMLYCEKSEFFEPNPFGVEITQENYVNEASEILVQSYDKYLCPWFAKSDTIEKAYEAYLMLNGATNGFVSKYSWLLQMERWEEASEFINRRTAELREYEKHNNCKIEYIPELENLFKAIYERNDLLVFEYIHNKERQTIKNLSLTKEFNSLKKNMRGGV